MMHVVLIDKFLGYINIIKVNQYSTGALSSLHFYYAKYEGQVGSNPSWLGRPSSLL